MTSLKEIQNELIEKTKFLRTFPVHTYGGFSGPWLENHYFNYFISMYNKVPEKELKMVYLPIMWTDIWVYFYYEQRRNPKNLQIIGQQVYERMKEILEYISKYEKEREDLKFYTVIQHDQGKFTFTTVFKDLIFPENLLTFTQSGIGEIPLPLIKDDTLAETIGLRIEDRKYRVSFCGRIDEENDQGGIRRRMDKMARILFGEEYLQYQGDDWKEKMKESVFSLCPRGACNTSFRLYEAIHLETIPIYIYSDMPILPFNKIIPWNLIIICVEEKEINKIGEIIKNMSDREIEERLLMLKFYKRIFTYEFICSFIFNHFVQRIEFKVEEKPKVEDEIKVSEPKIKVIKEDEKKEIGGERINDDEIIEY